ncbi:MAG: oligoendopeptidase F [Sphaerochaetaceae bacterium]|jgi:oligoendopeptidase F
MGQIKNRDQVRIEDTWKVEDLYQTVELWEEDYKKVEEYTKEAPKWENKVADNLFEVLEFLKTSQIMLERVYQYAFLLHASDGSNSTNQALTSRATSLISNYSAAVSYVEVELLAMDKERLDSLLKESKFDEHRVMVQKLVRFKDHILTSNEEKIMAMQSEIASKASDAFGALTNVDLDFGTLVVDGKRMSLTQSTYSLFLQHPDRKVRQRAYHKFYKAFDNHKNVITHLYDSSVKQNIFRSKVRSYDDVLAQALFSDKVDKSVYTSLIESVHKAFPLLHRYYDLRAKVLGLKQLSHYDVYVPLVKDVKVKHTYEEAVDVISNSLKILGDEYVDVVTKGLTTDRWVDRYENKGKRAGAFSSGIFASHPYILMNYNEDVLRDVFTLTHEAGHAMHSYYSAKNNPFPSYDYTIFEAEVASTFNEQLLADYMIKNSSDKNLLAYIIGKQIDDVVATLFRQTMFAEFEMIVHQEVEQGKPITVDYLRSTYRALLKAYFGPNVKLFGVSDLECLRIPHFYRAFYVYKYATGISAAIALANKVMNGDQQDRDDYLNFLKSGGSRYPIEALQLAGVDMTTTEPVDNALKHFGSLLDRFEQLVLTKGS